MELPVEWPCYSCENQVELHALRQCSNCGPRGGNDRQLRCISLCSTCRLKNCTEPGHMSCWEEHLPTKEKERKLHTPIDPLPGLYVDAVTYSESDPRRQQRLHEQDRIAQWFTIKVDNSTTSAPRLCVTDRFRQLCDPGVSGSKWSKRQYPGFVSFIGNTGIGKSTLLRAMILMGQVDPSGAAYELDEAEGKWKTKIDGFRTVLSQKAQSPVSRSASLEHMTDPTSFGVHLYRDVATSGGAESQTVGTKDYEDTPILFADCEGFRAGHATTNQQRFNQTPSPNLISESPITATSYGKYGKEGVDLFYARFLYTVSDVVVFVMSGDTELYPSMQQLVEWAASAVHRSVNHLAHKTLVVVRNMAVLHSTELYNENTLRSSLFLNLEPLWTGSPILEDFRNTFNEKQSSNNHMIYDNADLLGKFFSDVRFCYIPDASKAPPDQIFKRYQTLRHQIVEASQESQKLRAKAWMQYNVPTLSHILNRAFEHFRTSDKPFDFYKAARNDNPNPAAVSDHIANFIRHLHLAPSFPPQIITNIISICLVTWALRTFGSVQEPYEMFSRKLENWCREGIAKFSERDQKCGQILKGGGICVNRRATHGEHCDEKGNISPGPFDEALKLPSNTLNEINTLFIKQYSQLCKGTGRILMLPHPEQSRQFRETTLQRFKAEWKIIQSNKTCLACLQAVPDHVLECGHSFCHRCVQEFGRPCNYFESSWVMDRCALCESAWQDGRHLFHFHPSCAGVRALTLDGGGIRGIVELALLEKLDSTIGLEIPLRDYFDLIMGTSTGGIIALGLATKDFSTTRLKAEFMALATKTFEKRREGTLMTMLDPFKVTSTFFLLLRIWESVYRTSPLKDGLKRLFGSDQNLFSAARRPTRVAVTSVKDNGADKCLITNYNRLLFGTDHDFEREDESQKDMKIWEAGLATAAAPFYFRKYEKPETKKNYTDGALHANFPVPYALEEIARVWARSKDEKVPLDILLSVGTGIQNKEITIPMPLKIGGFQEICTSFHNSLNSQKSWVDFERVRSNDSDIQGRVHRLNARIEGTYVALDHYKRMKEIDASVAFQVKDPIFALRLRKIADLLIANLFFFEPDVNVRETISQRQSEQLSGTIRCRLARDSCGLKNLVDAIDSFWYKESRNTDKFPEGKSQWMAVPLSVQQRNGIKTQGHWLRVECKITPMEPHESQQILAVTLRRTLSEAKSGFPAVQIPISGFPINFYCLKKKSK